MAWQLIYTSAPRTLSAGQSGYGTVARNLDLREALIQKLEQLSYYRHQSAAGPATAVISAYRILNLRGAKYHLLTRIQDAGLDFTNRTNHLAQHLVFAPEELAALPSPAIIFQQWNGWRSAWREEPRFLDEADWGNFSQLPRSVPLPAETWLRVTGDAGRAAALVDRSYASGCHLLCQPGDEPQLLQLFAESLQLLDPENKAPAKRWQVAFTTRLQNQDNPADFGWRGDEQGSAPGDLPVPDNALAAVARRGPTRVLHAPSAKSNSGPTASDGTPTALRLAKPAMPRPVGGGEAQKFRGRKQRPSKPEGIEINLLSPRVLGPLIGIALLLIALFVWPKWISSTKKPPAPSAIVPAETANTDSANGAVPEEVRSDGGFEAPEESKPKPALPVALKAPPPPAQALEKLAAQMDAARTYLFIVGDGAVAELRSVRELETLLNKIMDNLAPVAVDGIQCLAQFDSWQLTAGSSGALYLRLDMSEKILTAADETGEVFRLEFRDWYESRSQPHATPPRLRMLGARQKCLTVLFRAPEKGTVLMPFRIVAVNEAATPSPLQLSKAFLSANRTNWEDSLDESLRDKLKSLVLPAPLHWQLRPFAGVPPTDLYDRLAASGFTAPNEGSELNFKDVLESLSQRIVAEQKKIAKATREIEGLKSKIAENNGADIELGKRFGFDGASPLASFATFAQASKREMTRETFVDYLQNVFKGKLSDARLKKLDDPRSFRGLHSEFERELADVPAGYFQERWKNLGRVNDLIGVEGEKKRAELELAKWRGAMALVPPNLDGAPAVGLFLVGPKVRLEVIRFTDPPTPKKVTP